MNRIARAVAFKPLIVIALSLLLAPATAMAQNAHNQERERQERSANFTPAQEARLDSKQGQLTYQDLAHEHLGCPANSACSEQMGKKMKEWEDFIAGLKNKGDAAERIEAYRKKRGLPVAFLTRQDSGLSLDPILFSSRCQAHNPKEKENSMFIGIQFFRNDPRSKMALFDPVFVLGDDGAKTASYRVPYEESPIMIHGGNLIIPREHENVFYYLSVSPKGEWKVANPPAKQLRLAMQNLENAACPEEKSSDAGPYHLKRYCKKIWNADQKKQAMVRLLWSCP